MGSKTFLSCWASLTFNFCVVTRDNERLLSLTLIHHLCNGMIFLAFLKLFFLDIVAISKFSVLLRTWNSAAVSFTSSSYTENNAFLKKSFTVCEVMGKKYIKSAWKCNCHKVTHQRLSVEQSRNVLQIYECMPQERSEDLILELPVIAFQRPNLSLIYAAHS